MANCSPTTLVIGRPTKEAIAAAKGGAGSCGGVNPAVCCPSDIGPRPKRDKVREQIHDFVLLMLGAPVIKIELDEQQVDLAIDRSLQIYEDYSPREHYDYFVFQTQPGKSVYEMPPDVGFVRNVFYKEQANFAFQASDLDGAIPIEYFYPGGAYSSIQGGLIDPIQPIWGRMGEWVLYKQYEQMYSRVSSNLGGWEWVSGYRHIKLYPIPCKPTHVIVHYLQRCKDWDCVVEAMQEGALAHAKIMLGRIRGKYTNIPGPQGGIQLDGQQLLQEGHEMLEQWREKLIYRYGDVLPITMD